MGSFITDIEQWLPFRKKLYHIKKSIEGRERRVSYGCENPDKTFYVIGQDDKGGGLFWLVNKTVMHIAYAEEKGYIPVVDYKSHVTQYTKDGELGKYNIWEMFFVQPAGYGLEDIEHSRNVIINKMSPSPRKKFLMGQQEFYDRPERIEFFRDIFKRNIFLNKETAAYLESMRYKYLGDGTRTVGVLSRGTDYVLLRPKGHPVQPNTEMLIGDVRDTMEKYSCDRVFLATEDADILNEFRKSFGNRLVYIDQKRTSKKEMSGRKFLADERALDKERNQQEEALQYLTAIHLLTQCQCFLGGRTGGTKGVLLMAEGFEYSKVYDLGMY